MNWSLFHVARVMFAVIGLGLSATAYAQETTTPQCPGGGTPPCEQWVITPDDPDPTPDCYTQGTCGMAPNPGGTGNTGGGAGAAEQQRQATCAQANADWASKDCSARRVGNRPRDNYDIQFAIVPLSSYSVYEYLRGAALAFHQALWDDLTGSAWNNFNDNLSKFYQACETYAGGFRPVSVAACKFSVDSYFGATTFTSVNYAAFQGSQAATDAQSSRDGQVCTNIAAVRAQNQCN